MNVAIAIDVNFALMNPPLRHPFTYCHKVDIGIMVRTRSVNRITGFAQ